MASISDIIFYTFIFFTVYVQVFFFITFFENRASIVRRDGPIKLSKYPAVTIAVPCWNEEKTIYKTVRSLLGLNYPKDKLKIFLIDDGSTDSTWNIIRKFEKYKNIKVIRKENGGKHTALNLALSQMDTEFFGGLDADSFADREALVRLMSSFEKDPTIMAVVPSVTVHNPSNIIQNAQEAEYHMGLYTKKMLSFLGAINVTPGPLTIFRKKVFDDLGPYRHGHNTEDMEIAYRMQKNSYKIEHCNDAFVYTTTPTTVRKLYRQRLRWIYGFLNNTIDYRSVFFNKRYGNFSLFTLPMGLITVVTVSYLFSRIVYNFANYISSKVVEFQTVGWHFSVKSISFHPDLFFVDTKSSILLITLVYSLIIFSIIFGGRMAEGKWKVSINMVYFFVIFRLLSPFWLLKAIYNTIVARKPNWR